MSTVAAEGEFGSLCETVYGVHEESSVQFGSGNEARRPENSLWMEPGDGCVGGGTVAVVGQQGASCVLGTGVESV